MKDEDGIYFSDGTFIVAEHLMCKCIIAIKVAKY